MEYIGKKIQIRELVAVCTAAFFAGRICLFDGMFPAAPAFVIAMLSVSTVYIYLLPVILGAMALYLGQGVYVYGDMLAVTALALFLLFFHRHRFTLVQKSAMAAVTMILCNLVSYAWADMLFLLRPESLAKDVLAFCVFVQAYDAVARTVFHSKKTDIISRDRIAVSMEILVVSYAGVIGPYEAVLSLWLVFIASTLYIKGLKEALALTGITVVCSLCMGESSWNLSACIFAGVVMAWAITAWVDPQYQKAAIGSALFLAVSGAGGIFVYGFAVAAAAFIAIPEHILKRAFCTIEQRLMPEAATEKDLQHLAIERNLQKKKEAFLDLGSLYGRELEGKQILSYQFTGMARTIERLQTDLHGKKEPETTGRERLTKVAVGQASYSFDEVSGDSMAAFAFDDHRLALIISDGMGKGREAAAESRMVVTTLSKLLQAGFDVDLAMKTVNGILMACCDEERFATVDLAIIDRAKCRAKIYKMGAATTFIKHDGRVSMLKRQALPAGITGGPDLEYIDIKLKRGDLLVMVSDGVTDCDRKDPGCDWLRERLLQMGSRDPETVAELVVNKAAEKYGIRERDDLSVMTAAIGV